HVTRFICPPTEGRRRVSSDRHNISRQNIQVVCIDSKLRAEKLKTLKMSIVSERKMMLDTQNIKKNLAGKFDETFRTMIKKYDDVIYHSEKVSKPISISRKSLVNNDNNSGFRTG
ncbi:hypothetical protein L9F63_027153, partial [Diploptera punctata]